MGARIQPDRTQFATGSNDGTVRIWDRQQPLLMVDAKPWSHQASLS
jgi:WD40 repeat protein